MSWVHLITVILLIAKLAGYFNYSWWLVFLPSIVSIVMGITVLLGIFLISIIFDNK